MRVGKFDKSLRIIVQFSNGRHFHRHYLCNSRVVIRCTVQFRSKHCGGTVNSAQLIINMRLFQIFCAAIRSNVRESTKEVRLIDFSDVKKAISGTYRC